MGSQFDVTAATAVTKYRYSPKKILTLNYPDHPFYAMVPKKTDAGGAKWVCSVRSTAPQTRSTVFANAQAYGNSSAGSASIYKTFYVDYYNDYATANITGEAIDRCNGDENSMIDLITTEVDGAYLTLGKSIANALYRNGGGQIGKAGSISTTTLTLSTLSDAVNFEVGMPISMASDDGTTGGGARTGTGFIAAVDRDAGTLQVASTLGGSAANWTTVFTGATAGDFLFPLGDYTSSPGTLTKPAGLSGWVPSTAPTSTLFYQVNRASDVVRLGGLRVNGSGGPMEETIITALARAAREGAMTSHVFMNPEDVANLMKSQASKVMFERASVKSFDSPEIGFQSLKCMGPKGPVDVVADQDCPIGSAWAVQMDTFLLVSMGKVPKPIQQQDGLLWARLPNQDAYELRLVARYALACHAPGYNVNITW